MMLIFEILLMFQDTYFTSYSHTPTLIFDDIANLSVTLMDSY